MDIIFFGAGASKADGAPLQNEIFKKFYDMCNDIDVFFRMQMDFFNEIELYISAEEARQSNFKHMNKRFIIDKFFSNFFGKIINNNFPSFEEVFAILEIALQRKEEYSFNTYGKLIEYKEALIELINITIDYYQKESHCTYYKKLLDNLEIINKLNNIIFITTNYDLLIDNAVRDTGKDIDYGFDRLKDKPNVTVYKIHGSLNWNYCPICKKINYDNTKCPKCDVITTPIIIQPSFFKDYQNSYLSTVWNLTEQAFAKAENIIFCGYSFSDADIYIKYLLKRGEFLGKNQKYYIINSFNGKSSEDVIQEQKRYSRFFKNKENVVYTDFSFEVFADNPEIISAWKLE